MGFFSRLLKALCVGAVYRNSKKTKSKVSPSEYLPLRDAKEFRGLVYWGQLSDGTQIAVKRLNPEIMKGVEFFCSQAELLGSIRHKNLLSLKGYCAEGEHRMLVYDYMHNSSLSSHLHGDQAEDELLDWHKRMSIAVGCAEGLAYLHHHSNPQLIHGGVKSTNVILNSNYEPLWMDFGNAYFLSDDVNKPPAMGYGAPENMANKKEVSDRSDIFSYGILLLELITGRNPAEKVGKLSIIDWAQSLILDGKIDELIDPKLQGKFDRKELESLLNAAIMCAQDRPENRLSMLEVLELFKQESA